MKKHFITVISALFLVTGFLFSCSNEIDNKSTQVLQALLLSQSDSNYGSLTVSGDSSRALDNSEITHAIVSVQGYSSSGSEFTKTSGIVEVSNGSASGVSVTQIPVCKNAVVSVQGYSDSNASTEVKGAYVTALVEIQSGSNSVNVTRETSKTACVYKALLDAGVNTNTLTDTQLSSINNAIPSGVDSCLIKATSIASAFKSNSLADADTYKLTTGSVTVTANQYNGYTFQITDPLSTSSTLSSTVGGTTSLSGVAPGTWKLIVWNGTTKVITKSVTVTSGESTSVTVGSATITDRIIVHLADSSNSTYNSSAYTHIYAWSVDSDSTKYAGGWPGTALSDSDGDGWYDYTIMNGTSYVTKSNVIFSKNGSPQTENLSINGAGEYWWNGSAFVTENPDTPPEPVTPSVSISPSSGEISLSSSISVTFDAGNDTITSATVTINGNTYNMGTSATTWSKSLSDLGITSAGTSITVSASVTNSVGTGSASASLTSKESGGLVENPNELRIYQVMVSSFQDGDSSIGYKSAYGPSNATKGGDLQGIINAADYIESLGCNALWMTPIFQSSGGDYDQMSSTGYFAYDYFNIDNHFGTNEKFAELVEVFHNKGIAVILDGVFGHNGGSVAASPNRTGIKYP
ncbi:MAG: starch-binding protein, partial [Treponema sp.]|nr:starch-binding protein [Treponema sp.]